jgi:hypothetical protein
MPTALTASWVCALFSPLPGQLAGPAVELDTGSLALPDPIPGPVLRAGNITAEAPHHDVKLFFPWWPGIDESTIGDGDIVARGPNGYHQPATFVSLERLQTPLPLPLTTVAEGLDDVAAIPQPEPILVVTYRFFPPDGEGDTWTSDDNGRYGVRLAENEIATEAGHFLPPRYLGGFRCIIRDDPGIPIQPEAVRCKIKRHPVPGTDAASVDAIGYHALVQMYFRTPHVDVDWGDVVQSADATFVANATALRLPIPGPDPLPVPLPLAGAFPPENHEGAPLVDPDPDRPDILPIFRHRYDLGVLAPGEYRFVFRVNGVPECSREFTVPPIPPVDDDPPEAELRVRNITQPNDRPQRMVVTYKDRSGVDISTIGDGDLVVFSPCLFQNAVSPIPCNWRAQRARLVEIISISTHNRVVKALYEIDAPRGGWTHEHNGFYPVVLWEDAVCDRLGNCTERERLGGFEVAIDNSQPPVPAEAEISVDAGNPDRVKAKVHIDFKEHWRVVDQEVRRHGNRIYLLATAEQVPVIAIYPPPPPPQQDLLYEIGPLRDGEYVAAFIMNRHVYDAEKFEVKREPPIPADVDLTIDTSDPDNVVADVTIQFRTPHRVVQGDVERNGHRIVLPANAQPLPITDAVSVIPPPVHLRYEIGALAEGCYLGVFVMNEFPYAAEHFTIRDPGPPIDADVSMRIDQSDPDNTVAVVKIAFKSPHVIVERGIHQHGNRFILEATARPIHTLAADTAGFAPVPVPQAVTLRYRLGHLDPGLYAAAFVMNGWPYAHTTWQEPDDTFAADVKIDVQQTSSGAWSANVKIWFENPHVRIADPGAPEFAGHRIKINATAIVSATTDIQPRPYEFNYDLGELRPGGYWLGYSINGNFEQHHDFIVPPEGPIPADVDVTVDTENQPVIATARIQFRDPYRITDQRWYRFGNLFVLDATAEGPLPILAPIPPPPIDLDYDLGYLPRGKYFAAFRMNGHFYDVEEFRISDTGQYEVEVDLSVDVGDEVIVKAVVDFEDPYVIITDPGTPVMQAPDIRIDATAERVVFVVPPSGDPQEFEYNLGALRPGWYHLIYSINGHHEACMRFHVPDPPDPPLPNISHIEIEQGDVSWFSEVGVILLPNQEVTSWGVVRREDNLFHVNITVDWVTFPPPVEPVPTLLPTDPNLPDGIVFDAANHPMIHDVPVRIVTHTYLLGVLDPGQYGFVIHSRGQVVTGKRFVVPGSPPQVELSAPNITEATDEYRFGISYHDPDGLDHESIMNAEVAVVGRDGYREVARLLSYASTDDDPSTHGSARYAVNGPGGDWDFRDNGRYCVVVDPEAIRDLEGNHLEHGRLGCFKVRILPDPPDPGVNVSVAMNSGGGWDATVEIISEPGEQVVVDSWGPTIHHGHTIVALASAHIEPTGGPVEPLAHVYPLGVLQPGYYVFVFATDIGHLGFARFIVPGLEADPIASWQMRASTLAPGGGGGGDDGDSLDEVGEYFFATDPTRPDGPQVRPEITAGDDGRPCLGVRFRRLHGAEGVEQIIEGSRDLKNWDDVSDQVDLIEQVVGIDGTEEVSLRLKQALQDCPYQYLRIRAVRVQN